MSVDFFVALPAADWPTPAAIQKCMADRAYPITFKRFPAFDPKRAVSDGALVTVDGEKEAYLEGDVAPAKLSVDDVKWINERMGQAGGSFQIKPQDALMSVHVRSPAEFRATSFVVAGIIYCFGGYGFEPQGNTHGREDFAKSLIDGAKAVEGL